MFVCVCLFRSIATGHNIDEILSWTYNYLQFVAYLMHCHHQYHQLSMLLLFLKLTNNCTHYIICSMILIMMSLIHPNWIFIKLGIGSQKIHAMQMTKNGWIGRQNKMGNIKNVWIWSYLVGSTWMAQLNI